MEKDEIKVGMECAYLKPEVRSIDPVRATVLTEADGGYLRVTLHHPDIGQREDRVRTRDLVGLWSDEPEVDRFPALRAVLDNAHAENRRMTWSDVAERRYGQVRRQRALADRLNRLGIVRSNRHYAGQGGVSDNARDAQLQLNHDELERLLDRAERGPDASYLPPSPDLEVTS